MEIRVDINKKYDTSLGVPMLLCRAKSGDVMLVRTEGSFAQSNIELHTFNLGKNPIPLDAQGRISIKSENLHEVYDLLIDNCNRRLFGRNLYHSLRQLLHQEVTTWASE